MDAHVQSRYIFAVTKMTVRIKDPRNKINSDLPQTGSPRGRHELFLVLEALKVDGQELGTGNLERKWNV